MSAVSPGVIRCDEPSCRKYFTGTGRASRTIYGARRQAHEAGWLQGWSDDYCPDHEAAKP